MQPLARLLLAPLALLAVAAPLRGGTYPTTAYVAVDDAPVCSGPGDAFYATQKLDWGTKVEVYRKDNDQWVAIRPPEGSFSWVEAAAIEETDDPALVRVRVDDAITRVGTSFGDQRHVEYIRLEKGEILEVLGSQVAAGPDGSAHTRWLKIAPVAGEYRWMRARDLSPSPPETTRASTSGAPGGVAPAAWQTPTEPTPREPTPGQAAPSEAAPVEDGAAEREPTPAPSSSTWKTRPIDSDTQPPSHSPAAAQPPAGDPGVPASAGRPAGPPVGTDEVLDAELDELDLQLSSMVAQPVTSWRLDRLREELDRLEAIVGGENQRRQWEALRARVDRFVRLQDRYRELMEMARPGGPSRAPRDEPPRLLAPVDAVRLAGYEQRAASSAPDLAGAPQATPTSPPARSQAYDGQGWLMPVFTSRSDVPAFALTDNQGQVLQFVRPAPGLNLRRYQRHQVGILGQQSYLPNLHKPLLTASRVVLLDRHSDD